MDGTDAMKKNLPPSMGRCDAVISIINNARTRAIKAVHADLIQMYWSVGQYLSGLCSGYNYGDGVIDEVAAYIAREAPDIKGFNRR